MGRSPTLVCAALVAALWPDPVGAGQRSAAQVTTPAAPALSAVIAADSDLGPAPPGPATRLTTLEIRNDAAAARENELAYSGVPLSLEANVTSLDRLAIVSGDGRRVAAQLSVLSRWGGSPDEESKPVRWLQVALKASVPARSSVVYELRLYTTALPDAPAHAADVRFARAGDLYTVETGAATFVLDPGLPGLIRSIERHGRVLYRDWAGSGPRVVDGAGSVLVPRPDPGSFAIEEAGPVKVVARLRGHFRRAREECGHDLGYVVRLTFERASADVGLQYHVINECGDGHAPAGQLANGAPWWNRTYAVNEVGWTFPLDLSPDREGLAGGASDAVHRAPDPAAKLVVEQERGRPGPVYRSARVSSGGTTLEQVELLESPFVALADGKHTAILQMPWMRYREPQALVAEGEMLSFRVISRPAVIGEAQAVWGFARLSLLDGGATDTSVRTAVERARAALERGLLVHVPVEYLDATRVMPPLTPSDAETARRVGRVWRVWNDALNQVHADTVRKGGQWERRKAYGFATWPDYSASEHVDTVDAPSAGSPSSNYWSATATEFTQWFVDGDPKWVWDFALPQEYTQLFTNYYNLGSRNTQAPGNYRGGFTPIAGSGAAEGEAFRSGWGSDDYTYNQGSDEAFLIRPSAALTDRFADAAETFIRRYGDPNIPASEQRRRDEGLQALSIGRAQAQHVNFLSYAAQFSPGGGRRYLDKLLAVMDEYVADNLRGGVFCQADYGNEARCVATWGIFHFVALQHRTFADFLAWFGPADPRGAAIERALATTAGLYHRVLMRARIDGGIDPEGEWFSVLDCTFRDGGATLAGCRGEQAEEPVYAHERPGALAFVLLIAEKTGNRPLCEAAARAFPGALARGLDYLKGGAGWNKGAAQSAHLIGHALAVGPCR